MNWTKEKPTENGYYWHISLLTPTMEIVKYQDTDVHLFNNEGVFSANMQGYWLGPLERPKRPHEN